MLTNHHDVFRGQSRLPNTELFHNRRYTFLLWNSNFVFKTCPFFWYLTSKNVMTLKSESEVAQDHWKWYHSIDCVWFPISVVTLSLRCTVFDIFDFKNAVTLKTWLLEMSPCNRVHLTSYWYSVVTMALSRVVSEIFNVKKCRDLEIGVKGHSRSLRVISFDRLCIIISIVYYYYPISVL